MKVMTNTHQNLKLGTSQLKSKLTSNELHTLYADTDTKQTQHGSSIRNQYSYLNDANLSIAPKLTNSSTSQSNLSPSELRHIIQSNSNSKKLLTAPEMKNDNINSKSHSDLNKRTYLGKSNYELTSNQIKKFEAYAGSRKVANSSKADLRSTLKEDKITLDPSSLNQNHKKAKIFNSNDPSPANSGKKKFFRRNDALSSNKKAQEFDFKDLLTSKKMTTSPMKKVFSSQEYSIDVDKDNSYNANRNLTLNIKGASSMTNNRNDRRKTANHSFSSNISPSNKAIQRSMTKDFQRPVFDFESSKQNNYNSSFNFESRTPKSTSASKGHGTPTHSSQFNENSKPYLYGKYSVSPTAAQQNFYGTRGLNSNQSFTSLYKQRRGQYQELLRGKKEEPDKSYANSTANQTFKSSIANTNSLETSEMYFASKGSSLTADIYNRLAQSTKNATGFRSFDWHKPQDEILHNRYKFTTSNILSEDVSLIAPRKQKQGKSVIESRNRSNLEDDPRTLNSQYQSKSGSRSHSVTQNTQESYLQERSGAEASKNHAPTDFQFFRSSKTLAPTYSGTGLTPQTKTNTSYDNSTDTKSFLEQERSYPRSTKNVDTSYNLDPTSNYKRNFSFEELPLSQNVQDHFAYQETFRVSPTRQNQSVLEAKAPSHRFPQDECLTNEGPMTFGQHTPREYHEQLNLPLKNINFIEYEEVPINEHEQRLNSREKKHTYNLESDRGEYNGTEANVNAFNGDINFQEEHQQNQSDKISREKDAETIEQLLKLVSRLKGVLVEDRNREHIWKDEKSHMQKCIDDLKLRLSRYES